MSELRLTLENYRGDRRWRWVLSDGDGRYLADHEVDLSSDPVRAAAAFDLTEYLQIYASPDRRQEDERRLVAEMAEWIGQTLLGPDIGETILKVAAPPVAVRVVLPQEAERIAFLPLDLAHARGRPLTLSGVRFIFEVEGERPPVGLPIGDRLRILALFSLPPAGSPLNLRRERQMLRLLVRKLTGSRGLAVDLRILQYGVTRADLREALEDGEGWDVIHFSGHGLAGTLVLESPDGAADLVSSTEIATMMRETGERLKLVLLSACHSAAGSIHQTLTGIGVASSQRREEALSVEAARGRESTAAPAVARALASQLDCAVLAMRYAVEDEFAANLAEAVYEGMFDKKQSLPQAVQLALGRVLKIDAGDGAGAGQASPLSLATPALFGSKAVGLKLVPPEGRSTIPDSRLAYFRPEPAYFVGRVTAMTRASATLAPHSTGSGVLFHGMAGAGKTACALELAYHHSAANRFRSFVWYEAPVAGADISIALRDFALAMELQVPGLEMVHVVDKLETFQAWLPRLTKILAEYGVLVVIDNLEGLLNQDGEWRDRRWALLLEALLRPGGLSRLVLTSRILPNTLSGLETIAVHSLPLSEAVLLMRELPNLRRLLDGTASDRELVRNTLRLVQGHPKLIHLADALAADRERLASHLRHAEGYSSELKRKAFFETGESSYEMEEFTDTLHRWTRGIADTLPDTVQICFQFMCAVEESDRESAVLRPNWTDLWHRLHQTAPPVDFDEALELLAKAGLVEKLEEDEAGKFTIGIHPGVAEAGRHSTTPEFERAVDTELAATWVAWMRRAQKDYGKIAAAGKVIARAALAAFPYLRRLRDWQTAGRLLDTMITYDKSSSVVAAALPMAREVLEAVKGGPDESPASGAVARLLLLGGQPTEAEDLLKYALAQTVKQKRFDIAARLSTIMITLLRSSGRLKDALAASNRQARYSKLARLERWNQISYIGSKLQIMNDLGENSKVLRRVVKLRKEMATLDHSPQPTETVRSWNVREVVLDAGREAALNLGQWEQALDFNAEVRESKRQRAAPPLDQATAMFNDYGPLLMLGNHDDARRMLLYCREIFEAEKAIGPLGKVYGALAAVEDRAGHFDKALHFQKAAIRLLYIQPEPTPIAIAQTDLAAYIVKNSGDLRESLAHRVSAAFLDFVTLRGVALNKVINLVEVLETLGEGSEALLPSDYEDLCQTVAKTEGVKFRELVLRLGNATGAEDPILQALYDLAREIRADRARLDRPRE
jgi:tetratricopeptide (TPR) repeat protein